MLIVENRKKPKEHTEKNLSYVCPKGYDADIIAKYLSM
jgi:rhodanese-related sulfurtransferase